MILLNSAPATRADFLLLRAHLETVRDMAWLRELRATAAYEGGDPAATAEAYRVHFRPALRRQEHVDVVVERLRRSFTRESILLARAIEDWLVAATCFRRSSGSTSRRS